MDPDEARSRIGDGVVYHPRHGRPEDAVSVTADHDIPPRSSERLGWENCHRFRGIGVAEIDHSNGDTVRYGVYGTRGDEIFVQFGQTYRHGGVIEGKSGLRADADTDVYYWTVRSNFSYVEIWPVDTETRIRRLVERAKHLDWPRGIVDDLLAVYRAEGRQVAERRQAGR